MVPLVTTRGHLAREIDSSHSQAMSSTGLDDVFLSDLLRPPVDTDKFITQNPPENISVATKCNALTWSWDTSDIRAQTKVNVSVLIAQSRV